MYPTFGSVVAYMGDEEVVPIWPRRCAKRLHQINLHYAKFHYIVGRSILELRQPVLQLHVLIDVDRMRLSHAFRQSA